MSMNYKDFVDATTWKMRIYEKNFYRCILEDERPHSAVVFIANQKEVFATFAKTYTF